MLGRERRCLGKFTQRPRQACHSYSFQRWYCSDPHGTSQVPASVSGSQATILPSWEPANSSSPLLPSYLSKSELDPVIFSSWETLVMLRVSGPGADREKKDREVSEDG